MPEVLILSPYPELSRLAHEILTTKDVDFEVIDVPALVSEEIVSNLDVNAKVIISRGGVAKLARHYTNIPVIEIPVTLFDIMDACNTIPGAGNKKKAIISSANIIYNPNHISKIRDLRIDFFSCPNWIEERVQLEQLAQCGEYDAIIGDALAHAIADKYGIPRALIQSSEDSLNLAVDEALRIVATHRLDRQMRIQSRKEILEKGWVARYTFRDILGLSTEIKRSVKLAKLFAKADGSVLISGETGTGKELFAQSIHNESDRVYGPFVSVNCGALNDNLFESELFGYDGGAFTGASRSGKKGLFECANKGTIFLDEISETSINAQAKLLRVLQERKLRRVGSEKVTELDARVICATNKNLLEMVEHGEFRRDLYYRLNELELVIPPLHARQDDILLIAEALLKIEVSKIKKNLYWQGQSVFEPLRNYTWPGNIRELRNFIIKLVTYAEEEEITKGFVSYLFSTSFPGVQVGRKYTGFGTLNSLDMSVAKISVAVSRDFKQMEKELFKQLLLLYNGDKNSLCEDYGISKMTLWRKLNYKNDKRNKFDNC